MRPAAHHHFGGKRKGGMSLVEVLLALCLCSVLVLGAARLIAMLREQLDFCEKLNREIFLAGDSCGTETIGSEDGFLYRLDWQIRDDFPAAGLGLLSLEIVPAGSVKGKLVCKTLMTRD